MQNVQIYTALINKKNGDRITLKREKDEFFFELMEIAYR
jgi:hypothetical protein